MSRLRHARYKLGHLRNARAPIVEPGMNRQESTQFTTILMSESVPQTCRPCRISYPPKGSDLLSRRFEVTRAVHAG